MAVPTAQTSQPVAAQFSTVKPQGAASDVDDFKKVLFDNANALRFFDVTIAPGLIGAGAEVTTNTALPAGITAAVGDFILAMKNTALEAGIYVRAADVAVADQVRVIWRNETAAGVTPASRNYGFLLVQAKRITNLNTN